RTPCSKSRDRHHLNPAHTSTSVTGRRYPPVTTVTRITSMKALLMTLGLLTLPLAGQAAEGFFKQLTLPTGLVLAISEGRGEPASIGSYDVRLYSGANPQFPLDQFID